MFKPRLLVSVFVVLAATLAITGCSGLAEGPGAKQPKTAVDYRRALNPQSGDCMEGRDGATPEDYTACLKWRLAQMSSVAPPPPPVAPPAAPPQGAPGQQPPAAPGNWPQGGFPQFGAPQGPQSIPGFRPPSGYYPGPSGARCEVDPRITILVVNRTRDNVQLFEDGVNPRVIPLSCDAAFSQVIIPGSHPGEEVMTVRPMATATFVCRSLDGCAGTIRGIFLRAWMPNRVNDPRYRLPSSNLGEERYAINLDAPPEIDHANNTGYVAKIVVNHGDLRKRYH